MKRLKKYMSIVLVFVLLFVFQTPAFANQGVVTDSVGGEYVKILSENKLSLDVDGHTYIYEVDNTYDKTSVIQRDENGNIVEEYIYDSIDNSVYMVNADILIEDVMSESDIQMNSNGNYIDGGSMRFSVKDLCVVVGTGISVATFVGLIIAAAGGVATVTTPMLKAIISAAVTMSLNFGALIENHGINVHFRRYWTRVCRGSDCYEGYYRYEAVSWSKY